MRTFATKRCRQGIKGALVLPLFFLGGLVQADESGSDEGLRFDAKTTLGTHLYIITSPFDTSDVSGFFNQWRYIRDQGGSPPFFVDLFHADLGLRRADDTWLARVERWSFNSLNEHGLFDFDWKGLTLEGQWRRYRGDYLRVFPEGTGTGTTSFGSQYFADTPNSQIFDNNRRFWIRRENVGGEVSLRPDQFGWDVPVLEQIDVFGEYGTRDGYLQEGTCLLCPPAFGFGGFRGLRREVDETISTVGGGLVVQPIEALFGALRFRFQSFREDAPDQTLAVLPTVPLDFVPDTDRLSGRIDFQRRFGAASLQGGATVNHLEQVGRKTPAQEAANLRDNDRTSYSLWTSFDWPVASQWDVTGFAKWFHLHNGIDPQNFDVGPSRQDSPYIRELGALDANVELGFRPVRGARAAFGYRADYSHRNLRYGQFGMDPALSLVRPDSLHHIFYLSGRMRARSLQLEGKVGYDWGPETAYPNEFSEAVFFEGRGSYTLPAATPLTLSVSGAVTDGKAPGFVLQASNEQTKEYQRLVWNYDVTLAANPVGDLSLFASYSQQHDDQDFNHVRIQRPRQSSTTFSPNDLFVDSNQRYQSDLYSLTIGGSHPLASAVDISSAISLTWARARFSRSSNTGIVLDEANRIRNRIVTFETDIDYLLREFVTLGVGYRLQAFDDHDAAVEFLDYTETVHTFTVRVSVDFEAMLP